MSCSYGTDLRPTCRDTAVCNGSNWTVAAANCTALEACTLNPGDACDANATPDCALGDLFCTCAGTIQCSIAGSLDCPTVFPNAGTSCSLGDNVTCSYNSCNVGWQLALCSGSVWFWADATCAP